MPFTFWIFVAVVSFAAIVAIYEAHKKYSKTEEEKRQENHERLSVYLARMSDQLYDLARMLEDSPHRSFSDQAPEVRAVANEIDKLRQRNESKYPDASPETYKSRDS